MRYINLRLTYLLILIYTIGFRSCEFGGHKSDWMQVPPFAAIPRCSLNGILHITSFASLRGRASATN